MGLTPVVVAIDGGGSKTDAAALTLDGELLATRRGPGCGPHVIGVEASLGIVDSLVAAVCGGAEVSRVGLYVSGLDQPHEVEEYRTAALAHRWAARGLDVGNDIYALLRAGTDEPDAVAVVCGTGMNAVGLRADGAEVRFPALGPISGDWGGGGGLGLEALWFAARAVDGRGEPTALTAAIEAHFGLGLIDLILQLHSGERAGDDLVGLAPLVLAAAAGGDAVAGALVDRQAAEVVSLARACLSRLGLTGREVPVVLGGGIIQSGDQRLLAGIRAGLAAAAPGSRAVVVGEPPIVGAALLTLAHARAGGDALARARAGFEEGRP